MSEEDTRGIWGVRSNELSPQEERVAALIARGLPNKAISKILDIATDTVKVHVRSILKRTDLSNRTQLAMWVVDNRPDLRNLEI